MDIRYASHPNEVKQFDTERLQAEFQINSLFSPNEIKLVYSHVDRFIIGGVLPITGTLQLQADKKEMAADYFLERREIGIINVGGRGTITVDGTVYNMDSKDCIYIGLGAKDITFASDNAAEPAKFYFNSTPAHQTYPTVKVAISEATPTHLGSINTSNERTIYKYIHTGGVKSCQLVMGMTLLKPGNMWNTMPSHTHNRRSEVYFYFDMPEDAVVFHMMGEPQQTRHVVMRNEQAVISPSWSIHSGVGTNNYTFIWGMAGENQMFDDMDAVAMKDLK
ncbi:5-dehydro-4-deoxy-D-glucuronate isomerase [Paenibacillus alginolyticus]|jgi:4-deoxy-L-threo-5-hexosulose-uronate ketol-isomerase|uniref:4-deoxy-L-threo-5-hexosulose-uronate ketol-isomerase n=1 Tax=Paenibacillus alginolyticus TaxID=59839 RepID=A0ABT4G6U5_9BACL|nr:5-dehydro-4-deoxy-D-glucuronate isomerase [Paenibacillus alginolyticus]MCY9669361.1 5-dehydro-4-deoxy-D-glucuronate isomerase [Paenibacillus alginolyticus]MCY9691863.1 5-dehydro-4-deoxy-D-glucuronate isomerase [Paenibacillus alginolyticus]MEC0142155.1 5-dehydro-4-deoxy-D-glucuronate isomerase [Paenibacillus alginolyticus]